MRKKIHNVVKQKQFLINTFSQLNYSPILAWKLSIDEKVTDAYVTSEDLLVVCSWIKRESKYRHFFMIHAIIQGTVEAVSAYL